MFDFRYKKFKIYSKSDFFPNYAEYVSDQFDNPYYENGITSTYSALLN